jgi:Uncharacterised protein family (UPF0236).
MPLQRAVTDFGADISFADAAKKMNGHYGLDLPPSTIRIITEAHANNMRKNQKKIDAQRVYNKAPKYIVAELDGGMVPIVTVNRQSKKDKRKTRMVGWRESRLSLAHAQGSIAPIYKATLGTIDKAGKQLAVVVKLAGGGGKNTRVHALGDGAPWIAEQVDQKFGSKGKYTIDFFHLSSYISGAAECIAPNSKDVWRRHQQELLKKNQTEHVLKTLKKHIDNCQHDHECKAFKCHQYMEKRMHQFDYLNAIENKLPIGSGEVESGHRSVVQKRLKLPGAWWLEENAENMLVIRTVRANGDWGNYWRQGHSAGVWTN